MAANPAATATFTAGAAGPGQGDVMAAFSSRGPGGDFLKPDVTAPGVQILAGNTPTPDAIDGGPPGEYYQAIAGTSMASPHIAGAAALIADLHPTWTPGQIKSALMTTAITDRGQGGRITPADPFDIGAGRINLNKAGDPGLTFDETAANYAASATTPGSRIDLNLPSINVTTMPGSVTTSRTGKNVTTKTLKYRASGVITSSGAGAGAKITVSPSSFSVAPGASQTFAVTITAPNAPNGQYFGYVLLDNHNGTPDRDVRLPVAFFKKQGGVTLVPDCAPTTISRPAGRDDLHGHRRTTRRRRHDRRRHDEAHDLKVATVSGGATKVDNKTVHFAATLAGEEPAAPDHRAGRARPASSRSPRSASRRPRSATRRSSTTTSRRSITAA